MRLLLWPLFLGALFLGGCATRNPAPEQEAYGVWEGTLPCADCPGIETRLTLYKDPYRYRLSETYLSRSSDPVIHEGEWVLLPAEGPMDLRRIELQGKQDKAVRLFRRLPEGNLEMLGRDGKKIPSALDYTLTRKRVSE